MNPKKLLLAAILAFPTLATAQSISQSQIDQIKNMPRAQQEALASQYGVDLDSVTGSAGQQNQRPENVTVVEPVDANSDEEQDRTQQQKEKDEQAARQPTPRSQTFPSPTTTPWAQATY